MQYIEGLISFPKEMQKKEQIQFFTAYQQLFQTSDFILVEQGTLGGGKPCFVPTWVERVANNAILN